MNRCVRHVTIKLKFAGLVLAAWVSFAAMGMETHTPSSDLPISVTAPPGWSCNNGSMIAIGDEVLPVLMCLPDEGGSPISLRRLARSESPVSLQASLSAEGARAKAVKKENVPVVPQMISLGEREAVEAAFQNHGVAHAVDGTPSEIEMIMHTLTFQMDGAFFRCQLDASPGLHNEDLRKTLIQFCSSARSAPAPASPGRS
jgi:hypothetical protein